MTPLDLALARGAVERAKRCLAKDAAGILIPESPLVTSLAYRATFFSLTVEELTRHLEAALAAVEEKAAREEAKAA